MPRNDTRQDWLTWAQKKEAGESRELALLAQLSLRFIIATRLYQKMEASLRVKVQCAIIYCTCMEE